MKAKRPVKDVEITITITETVEGKLHIHAAVPEHAAGTVAQVLCDIALQGAQYAMNHTLGQHQDITEMKSH